MVTIYGSSGGAWIAALPETLDALARDWGLTILPPFSELSYHYVAPAVDGEGRSGVVKLGVGSAEGDREPLALAAYGSEGAVRLIRHDPRRRAMLLERVEPGESLLGLGNEAAVEIAAGVMERLWEASASAPGLGLQSADGRPTTFPDLQAWTHSLERSLVAPGPLPRSLLERAAALRRELLKGPPESRLLHGDLHHANILRSEEKGWLAIDPKGIVGERAFDVVQFLFNPGPVPLETTRRRVDGFVEHLGLDRERVVAWAFVQAVVSACWTVEDEGTGWEEAVRFAEEIGGRGQGTS